MNKEIEYHPGNPWNYEFLYGIQIRMDRKDDAIATVRKWVAIGPTNSEAALKLSQALIANKNYSDAVQVLEGAAKTQPDSSALTYQLALDYMNNGQAESAKQLLMKSPPTTVGALNDTAYLLADRNIDLNLAGEYSKKALAMANEDSLKATIADDGYSATARLPYVWDTVGWIYFRDSKYSDSLPYLQSAWLLSQSPVHGYHLGQLYEKLGKTHEAIQTYKALASPGSNHDEIRKRYDRLTNQKGSDPDAPTLRRGPGGGLPSAGEELSRMRTFKLGSASSGSGSAYFTVVFSPGKVDSVRYVNGDE